MPYVTFLLHNCFATLIQSICQTNFAPGQCFHSVDMKTIARHDSLPDADEQTTLFCVPYVTFLLHNCFATLIQSICQTNFAPGQCFHSEMTVCLMLMNRRPSSRRCPAAMKICCKEKEISDSCRGQSFHCDRVMSYLDLM